ncbi:MAG: DinB family protein [Ignavibacteriales bacterium]|nr:DinB family protein [Ignavibacteriales bacterium]
MTKIFRTGAIGALLDEYERAAEELKNVLLHVSEKHFTAVVDTVTQDPDCRSIQTIMNHVVRSGYGYANYIRQHLGDPWIERKEDYELVSPELASNELSKMFAYMVDTFTGKTDAIFENPEQNIIKVRWGQSYDPEQLIEHAIVHVLRHRRQIEKFDSIIVS